MNIHILLLYRDCEKNIQDEVIVIEKPPISTVPKDRKRREFSGDDRIAQAVAFSVILCLLLIIFPALEMSSDGGKFNETVVIALIVPLVMFFQLLIFIGMTSHPAPVKNNIFGIIFILLLSTATSFIVVSLVSWTAAIIVFIGWGILILSLIIVNWEVISNEDMVFSKGIQILIAVTWFLLLAYAVKGIVDYFNL